MFNRAEKKWLKVGECLDSNGWSWEKILNGYGPGGCLISGHDRELKELLERVRIGQGNDGVVWRWDAKGFFTVKSAYAVLSDGGLRDHCSNHLWSLRLPTKVHILVWLVLKKRLLTTDNLLKRGWTGNTLCVLCGVIPETVDHLFTKCVFTRFVMWKVSEDLGSEDSGDDTKSLWEKWMSRGGTRSSDSNLVCLSTIWWAIWSIRNKVIFQHSATDPLFAVKWVNSLTTRWETGGGQAGGCDPCLTNDTSSTSHYYYYYYYYY